MTIATWPTAARADQAAGLPPRPAFQTRLVSGIPASAAATAKIAAAHGHRQRPRGKTYGGARRLERDGSRLSQPRAAEKMASQDSTISGNETATARATTPRTSA